MISQQKWQLVDRVSREIGQPKKAVEGSGGGWGAWGRAPPDPAAAEGILPV